MSSGEMKRPYSESCSRSLRGDTLIKMLGEISEIFTAIRLKLYNYQIDSDAVYFGVQADKPVTRIDVFSFVDLLSERNIKPDAEMYLFKVNSRWREGIFHFFYDSSNELQVSVCGFIERDFAPPVPLSFHDRVRALYGDDRASDQETELYLVRRLIQEGEPEIGWFYMRNFMGDFGEADY